MLSLKIINQFVFIKIMKYKNMKFFSPIKY